MGFTLVELVTVVVLVGFLAAIGGMLIVTPITSFTDQSRRAELTDEADNALQRISRELRNALPNSVRISGVTALEFLNTTAGGRYRARLETGGTGEQLGDTDGVGIDIFDVLGGITGTITPGGAGLANCRSGASDCLVLYNTGADYSAYAGNNMAAITAVNTGVDPPQITYDNTAGFPFPIPPSSQQRFFVVDRPISYICSANQLWRYENYGIAVAQPVAANGDPINGVNPQLLANNVVSCNFSYVSGAGSRHGLVTLQIIVRDTATNESVPLLYQTHVSNIP